MHFTMELEQASSAQLPGEAQGSEVPPSPWFPPVPLQGKALTGSAMEHQHAYLRQAASYPTPQNNIFTGNCQNFLHKTLQIQTSQDN